MNFEALADPLALVTLVSLILLFPWMGDWEHKRLARWNAEGMPNARLRHFRWISGWEWATVIVLLCWWFAAGREAAPLGILFAPAGWQWLAIGVGLAILTFLIVQMNQVLQNQEELDRMRQSLGTLEEMVPQTPEESRAFNGLSLTAGICEEIIYRGVLLAILTDAFGTWPAVVLSSLIFGIGHLYQGRRGVLKVSVIGLGLALLTVFSGSIFIAIVVHAVLDMTSGRLMSAAVSAPEVGGAAPSCS